MIHKRINKALPYAFHTVINQKTFAAACGLRVLKHESSDKDYDCPKCIAIDTGEVDD